MPTVPTGILTIDYGNPLTSGLIGVYVPGGANGGTNLVDPGNGNISLYGTATTGETGNEGLGMKATISGGAMAGTVSVAQRSFTNASLYWRGDNPTNGDNFANLMGPDAIADYNAPLRDGFNLRTQTLAADGFLVVWNDGSGNINTCASGGGLAVGLTGSCAATLVQGGSVKTYRDGAFVTSASYGTATNPVSIDSTARMQLGGTDHFGRYSNTITYVGYMWNRALSDAEMTTLDANPYAFLVSPTAISYAAFSTPQVDGRTITTMIGY